MSGLEPLAALGLVCNVLQLVEVGLKTATLCKNAYRTGEPDPELSVYAQNLADTASGLSQSLELSQQPLNLEDARLLTLARNCRDAEAEWRKKTPSRFLSQQQPRKRDRLGAAFRGVINKPEIDRLEGQLQKAKESLEADLLVGVFKRFDISKVQTDDLQVKLETLLQATSVSETKLHDLIQSQVTLINSQLSDHILRAEASTKAHVTTELARHESRLKSYADQGKGTILTEAEVRENSRRENEAYERLLRSFQYPDMNHRRNEIHSSHASTFHWIFEGENSDVPHSDPLLTDASDPGAQDLICSSFVTWLKSPEDRYWISGRPGTGKSVLMKFIISHQQTMNSLRQWQPDVQILAHFFWKVGSPMQSSYKGFLCSLAYQLCSLDKGYFMGCLPAAWSRKTGPGDWDNKDLQSIIASYLSSAIRPSCLFVDGIDEFMDDDGVGMLTDLLDSLQRSSRLVKIFTLAASSIFVEGLVRDISFKAEGVFLWAVLVTRPSARGISNGDSKDEIHKRLTKTPKKLYELYLDMWNRLGEDSNIYQRPTALIFKIVILVWQSSRSRIAGRALATWAPLISILELMVASSDNLLCTTDLEQRCEELWTRIPTRTAGFFEVTHTTILERLPELLWAYKSGVPVLRYDKMKVQAIHRTVFDFLIETEGEKKIMEHHTASQEELFIRTQRSTAGYRDANWTSYYGLLQWDSTLT
ncbi:hypothetical protein FOXB_05277 [Fusarium oxysporum f. sp. conglutinans Fo5176]|uniref:NACHT domain-containing protein n=1 Tax=Fusarium oxysporum (strain Fo5176) TaxID=660025 RepID=F9FFU8_FUSOF|nr:hypothetical protein FOXB_05277 [Fusarium oxysporum f. sp. conglutinans Fo5176]